MRNAPFKDDETSIATRAAWLHYVGGLTQSEVAGRLGLTSLKAHRLIMRANQEGLVKVFIDGDVAECVAMETRLSALYGLATCEVVPEIEAEDLPLKALGIAGAQFLRREIDRGENTLIGIGHGRTLSACVDYLPRPAANGTTFVSLLGGLTKKFSANPYDVIYRLAERTGAEAYVLPVPMFANTAEDRAVLLGQKGVSHVMDLARRADLLIAGIGTTDGHASLVETGMIEKAEMQEVSRAGGVGELLGQFFGETGEAVESPLSDRTLSLGREDLRERRIVAVAGGRIKVRAVRAVLGSGLLTGLVTDERTAAALLEETPVG